MTNQIADNEWSNVEPTGGPEGERITPWNFEENPSLTGVYKQVKTNVGANKSNVYIVKTFDGKMVSFWGTTVLNDRMAALNVGDECKIIYEGKVRSPKTGREFKSFQVLRRPAYVQK